MDNAPVAEHERSYYSTWSLNLNQTPPLYKHEQKDEIEDFAIKQLSMWSMMMNNNSKIV
ncbi:MAG: hypothetical protein LLG05_09415 [Porphyromonadaceae bacterium]|nr:hypothetical protein [Porphyromonadaceae bacterium]